MKRPPHADALLKIIRTLSPISGKICAKPHKNIIIFIKFSPLFEFFFRKVLYIFVFCVKIGVGTLGIVKNNAFKFQFKKFMNTEDLFQWLKLLLMVSVVSAVSHSVRCSLQKVYTARMILATALAGLVSLGVLYLLFRKKLKAPLNPEDSPTPRVDMPTEVIGLVHLGGCIVLLSVSSFINLPMWLITCLFFLSLVVFTMAISFFRRRSIFLIARCIIRAPWDLAPFVISMFILVLALDKYGITAVLGNFLSAPATVGGTVVSFGVSSFLAANVVNNIPMSVLYSSVITVIGGMEAGPFTTAALYAAVIGSNLGAFFTPTGALAGIMWTGQLHDHGVPFSFARFVKYGATVAIPAMAAALLGLWVCCM